jgi:methylmalonyl-CoA mutase cobalamin-binding domain/chain
MNQAEVIGRVLDAVANLEIDEVAARVREALAAGVEPLAVLDQGLSAGMRVVGDRFEAGNYYLTELILAGEVMKAGLVPLTSLLETASPRGKGTILLATVKGDIHDIGKNLVGTMLRAAGFEVVDLGADVPAQRIVDEARRTKAEVVGLSVLLTPMVQQLRATVEALSEAGLRSQVRIVIGGACTTPDLAEAMGVNAHGVDAIAAVRLCEQLCSRQQ